jgi:hypothetical protein
MDHPHKATIDATALMLELGKATYTFQAIEIRIKLLLPFLLDPGGDGISIKDDSGNWRIYLDSKEMLGNLVKLFNARIKCDPPDFFETRFRTVVQCRNDVIHHFALQEFSSCATEEDQNRAISYIKERRAAALPLLKFLDAATQSLLAAFEAPWGHDMEMLIEMPEWPENSPST